MSNLLNRTMFGSRTTPAHINIVQWLIKQNHRNYTLYLHEHGKQQSDQDEFTDEQVSVYSREHGKQQGDQDEFTDEQVLEGDHVAGQAGAGALLEPLYVHWKHMGIKP